MTIEERQEAAKWFQNRASHTPMPGAKMMFERAAEALSEGMQPHWIPCSERLPLTYEGNVPVSETYIVTVSVDGDLFVDKAYSFGTYIDDFWDTVVDWDEGNDVHVIAWMPLPKPYGGESDGNN